jgi:Protein of unknown function (DUF1559)
MKTAIRFGATATALTLAVACLRADTPKEETPKEPPATRAQIQKSANNLKQIGLAMHNFHDTYGHLPMAILDKNGKPLLSWRVAILPFIEQDNLYRQIKLDEAWDSDHNKKFLAKMPNIYKSTRAKAAADETFYRVFVGNGAMFDKKERVGFNKITDGLSNTIMAIEAGESVPWTKPDELEYDPKNLPELGGILNGNFHALFGDGYVRYFRKGKKAESLRRMIGRDDGQVVTDEDLKP